MNTQTTDRPEGIAREASADNSVVPQGRRGFLRRIAAFGAAVGGITGLGTPLELSAEERESNTQDRRQDPWVRRLRGTQRVVFHSHMPTDGLAIRWAEIFLNTQKSEYGYSDQDCGVVVGLNGKSIGWLFSDAIWAKYPSVGEAMGARGGRNPMSGIIASLIPRGVIVLACRNSIGLSGSRFLPENLRSDQKAQADFGKEVTSNLLPGVEIVPSMIVTLQQAQDRGCRYVYAGG